MTNSADPDVDLHCLQRHGISGISRTKVKLLADNILSLQKLRKIDDDRGNVLSGEQGRQLLIALSTLPKSL